MDHAPSFFDLFFAIVPLFLVGVMGMWFRKHGAMAIHADTTMLWLLINLFTPCLIIDSFLGNKALVDINSVSVAPILGFITVVIGLALSYLALRFLKLQTNQQGTFALCVSLYNYGYFPIPLIMLFFDKSVLGMLFVFNVGLEFAVWTLGLMTLTGRSSLLTSLKQALTPPLIAVVFSFIVNLWTEGEPLPLGVSRVIHMIGQATIPMALLLVGATIYDYAPTMRDSHPVVPVIVGVVLRLLVIPLIFLGMAVFLPMPRDLKTVLCIQAGMPSAVFPIILVKRYGGDPQLAIRIIVATSLLCLFTMPAWVSLALGL